MTGNAMQCNACNYVCFDVSMSLCLYVYKEFGFADSWYVHLPTVAHMLPFFAGVMPSACVKIQSSAGRKVDFWSHLILIGFNHQEKGFIPWLIIIGLSKN